MFDGETNFQYNERPISDILAEQAPAPPKFSTHNDFTVYVMGPYTAFNAEVAYDDAERLKTPFQNDPLFDHAATQVQLTTVGLDVLDKRLVRMAICSTNRSQETRITDECSRKRRWVLLTHRHAGMGSDRVPGRGRQH